MDTLFTPEVLEKILGLLSGAVDGSVAAIIVYFLLPAIIILISSSAWLMGVYLTIKHIKHMVCSYYDSKRASTDHIEKEHIRIHELAIASKAQPINEKIVHTLGISSSDKYKRFNKDKLNEFLCEWESVNDDDYITDVDFEWMRIALKNQTLLDTEYKCSRFNPMNLSKYNIKDIKKK